MMHLRSKGIASNALPPVFPVQFSENRPRFYDNRRCGRWLDRLSIDTSRGPIAQLVRAHA